MKQNKSYLAVTLSLFAIITIFSSSSCSKSSTDDDLVGNWKRSSEFEGNARTEAITFTIGNRVFVGGGSDGPDVTDRLQDFYEFEQATGSWIHIADFPGTARNSAVAFSVNGKGYVGTGYDGIKKLKDFWEYDPVADTWTQVADFGGSARYGAVAFSIGGKGYVATGYDGNYLKDLWEYTPATSTTTEKWTQKASLTGSKRVDAVVFVYNDLAYIVSGMNNSSYLNDFWVYNHTTNAWTEKRKITSVNDDEEYDDDYGSNITRSNAVAFVMNTKAYLCAGSISGAVGTTWEYDLENDADTWKQKTSLEGSAREGALAFTLNNRAYVTTGKNSSYYFDDLWEFFPFADQDDNDN